jgi:hypothetical protein
MQVSVAAGAIIAGASKQDIAACELFAEKIGLAFQSTCRVYVVAVVVFLTCSLRGPSVEATRSISYVNMHFLAQLRMTSWT